ncbi:MAG: hypothetical protein R3E75_06675 [Steroidobacteraceae bacterium]
MEKSGLHRRFAAAVSVPAAVLPDGARRSSGERHFALALVFI